MGQKRERAGGGSGGGGGGFKSVERKTYRGIRIEEFFEPETNGVELLVGKTYSGRNIVEIVTPYHGIIELREYKNTTQARKVFKKFDALLSKRYKLRIKNKRDNGGYKAKVEIVPP